MSRRNRKHSPSSSPPGPTQSWRRRHAFWLSLGLVMVASVAGAYCLTHRPDPSVAAGQQPIAATVQKAFTLDKLLAMPPDELNDVDIAEMNLLCATGLPGAEKLDVARCLKRLDEYAKCVQYYTEQNLWDFRKRPQDFRNSEAKFRVLLLISVLQREYSVHYNDRGERNCDFSNSKNPFIHGTIDDTNGGTCASMPVMYVAVGRRLRYPMKLVLAKTHVFARWGDANNGETFNIEGTNNFFSDHPDSYYQGWPEKITDEELKQGWYLKPLAPAEELAVFLHNRGNCLMDTGRFAEAKVAFSQAARLAPQDPLGQYRIASATEAMRPVPVAPMRRVPGIGYVDEFGVPYVYPNPMGDIERINAMNQAHRERMTQPPQPGVRPSPTPYGPPNAYGPQPPRQPGRP